MKAILSIVLSSVRSRRVASTILLLTVLSLAAGGITAARAARAQASTVVDREFERSLGPHLVVYSRPGIDKAVEGFLGAAPGVVQWTGPIGHFGVDVFATVRDATGARLAAFDPSHPWPIANPVLRSGRWADRRASDEVVVDHAYARVKSLRVGQQISVQRGTSIFALTIVGTALDFTDCFVPDCYPPRLYTSDAAWQRIVGDRDAVGSLYLARTRDAGAAPGVEAQLRDEFGEAIGSNSWPDTRHDLLQRDEGFGTFLRGFGLFVLLSSAFVVGSALTARAVARRREAGLLKAIGFSRVQVMAAVLIEHALLGLVAAALGWLGAGLVTSRLRVGAVRLLTGAEVDLRSSGLALTTAIVVASLVVATVLPALRWGRVSPDRALRDAPSGELQNSRLASVVAQVRGPMPAVLGAKDLSARPARSLLTAATVVVMVVVAVMSIGLISSMRRVDANPRLQGSPWHVQSPIPNGMTREQFGAALTESPGVKAWYSDNDVKASVDGRPFLARVMGGPPAAADFAVRRGQPLRNPGEAIVGYGFMREFGVGVGDQVTLSLQGSRIPLTIVGWYSETEDSGVVLRLREESLPPSAVSSSTDVRIVAAEGIDGRDLALQIGERFGVRAGWLTVENDLAEFISAAKVMALVIAAVVIAHVLASLVTSARERARDFGVLRAIGFTNRQLVGQGAAGAALLALGAVAVGLPLGWLLNAASGDLLSKELGAGPGLTVGPPIAPVVVAAVMIVMTAMLIGAIAARTVVRRPTATLVRTLD